MAKPLKLINEAELTEYEIIKEAYDPSKPQTIKIRGVYAVADKVNGNSRVYKYDVLKPAIEKFITEKIKTNTALEELEHPSEITINPDRVCARTLSLTEDNKSWVGESIVLASDEKHGIKGTTCGDLLAGLLAYNVACGHSTRGIGNVNEDNGEVEDYQLVCIDTVLNPSIGVFNDSNGNRCVNGILESKEFMINNHGEIVESAYDLVEQRLAKMPNTHITAKKAAYLGTVFTDFIKSITA